MREIRPSGSEGGEEFNPLSLPLSDDARFREGWAVARRVRMADRYAGLVMGASLRLVELCGLA
jgi:hypothetical protein